MSVPQSIIYICSGVRLDNRYEHSVYFPSQSVQQEYFAGKVVKTFPAYSYLRKSWPLQVEATMEQAKTWSYLFFRNGSGKFYYYFINQVEYKNDNMVELTLELDVLQTYLFDFELLDCFVERQHTTTDVIGEHTVPEGLEMGEFVNDGRASVDPGEMCIMIMSTINPEADSEATAVPALPYMYNGVFSGIKFWAVDPADWVAWGNQLDVLDSIGQTGAIVAMWMYPKSLVKLGGEDTWNNDNIVHVVEGAVELSADDPNYNFPVSAVRPGNFGGYVPKNKKLFTYPYTYIYATNNQGASAVYQYERFDDNVSFHLSGAISPDGGVRLTPIGYKNVVFNYAEGLTLTGYPMCAWDSDPYKLWLAQNQNSQYMNIATGVGKIAGGLIGGIVTAATGVGAAVGLGTAVSGALQIGNTLAQKADRDIEPPQAKGNFSTSVNIVNGMQEFSLYFRTITAENARIIDDYFTMYGYKLNRVQKPNINARPAYTYVKTIGCHIKGDMCTEDIVKVENIFDNGVTFWKNGDKVADYSQTNTV